MIQNIQQFGLIQNRMDNSQKDSIPQLPILPVLTIAPPELSDKSYDYFYKRKHIMQINGQEEFSSSKEEVEKKLTKQLQRAEENSQQLISTGQGIKIDETLYTVCSRCNKSVLTEEMSIHMSCHAAIILDNLLLGDKISAQSKKELMERNKVTHVVNAASQLPNYLEKQGIKYLQLELYDNLEEQLESQLERAYAFIKKSHEEGGVVFVHCAVGKSRSVSVILTYLMKEKGLGIKEGLKLVKQKRPVAQPNVSYMKQLLEYERKWVQAKANLDRQKQEKTNEGGQNSSKPEEGKEEVSE